MRKTMGFLFAVLAAAGFASADRAVDLRRPLPADGRVEISNVAGEVKVVGWPESEVAVSGTLEDKVRDLEISTSGNRLLIEVKLDGKARYSASAFLTVKVPATADVEVEAVSADISVAGVTGDLDLESVSGRVEVEGEPSSVTASSVSGDVRVASSTGRSELESVSGDVVVARASDRLEVSAVSGDIVLEGGILDSLDLETVSGSVYCHVVPGRGGRLSLESMSGTVELVVPSDIDADIEIETYSGSIKSALGPEPARSDAYGPGRELHFTAGAGGARIAVESFSGNVLLRTR
jgi:DUF4097 and DUF4098 domain-containing protein YvlB